MIIVSGCLILTAVHLIVLIRMAYITERLVKLCKIYCDIWHRPTWSVCTDENECAVFVQWLWEPSSSDCPILFHTISYRRQGKKGWKRLNITQANTNRQKLETECSTEYEFQLVAWNEVGSSPFTTKTYTTKVTELKTNERGIYNANGIRNEIGSHWIERFHMASRQPYWFSKTMIWQPC